MRKSIPMAMLMAALCSTPVLANPGPYVSASIGAVFLEDSDVNGADNAIGYDTGYGLNAAAGYDFGPTRLEGAIGYQQNGVDENIPGVDADLSVFSVMANGYLDVAGGSMPVQPYVMFGIGLADVDGEIQYGGSVYSDSDTVLAWQIGAGIGIDAGPNLIFDIGYRYFAPNDAEIDGANLSLDSHAVMAGLRYSF